MPMAQIGSPQRLPDGAALQRQGLDEAHEIGMGRRPRRGATLIRATANNDVGSDRPLGLVVVHGHARYLQAGHERAVMREDAPRQPSQGRVVRGLAAPREQARLQPLLPPLHTERRQRGTLAHQASGIEEDPTQAPMGVAILLGEFRLRAVAQLPQQMDPAFLLRILEPVVGAVEVKLRTPEGCGIFS